ncbi:MAG: SGNH/GDSL hydrolase family protein [Bacteroidaceae bacterium]|nr:SGNH/GDSL hydrolase family protein [Bacteroidaceae bacterium]
MKLLLYLLLTTPVLAGYAQAGENYNMVVSTNDGNKAVYATNQIESVTFTESEEGSAGTTTQKKVKIEKNVVFLGHSIWRNDNYTVKYSNSGSFVTPFSGSFKGIGYQTLLKEVFDFESTASPGPNGGYSGYSLGAQSASDASSIAVTANSSGNGWPSVKNAIWTVDFITNDFKRNINLGSLDDYRNGTGPTTFYGAARQLFDKIKQLSGDDVIIVFANALPRNNSNYTSTSKNSAGCTLADYELALLTIAALNTNMYFVDQNRLSGITDQNLPAVTADGLHLNNLGYQMAVQPWIAVFRMLANKL